MAKIRVSNGRFGLSLLEALRKSKQGDVLVLAEGEHIADSVFIDGLQIVGNGDPSKVIVRGQFQIRGNCKISNLTIHAPHFQNALYLNSVGARLDIEDCTVYGEPAWKYPAVFNSGGITSLKRVRIHYGEKSSGLLIEKNGELHAIDSELSNVKVIAAKATLNNCKAFSITCEQRARVTATGFLDLDPGKGLRSIVLEGESVCTIETLRESSEHAEGFCNESFLNLGKVIRPKESHFIVVKKGRAVVETDSSLVKITDLDLPPAPTVYQAPEPKIVSWRPEDARNFASAIAPQLNKGDTLLLAEGEYFLDDYDQFLRIGVDFCGTGRAEKTILNGTLAVAEGASITISNLTLRPTLERNAIIMDQGISLTMTNLILESQMNSEVPSIFIGTGTAKLEGCQILAWSDATTGGIDIDGGAQLSATDSGLGWVRVWGGSSARLEACHSLMIWAKSGSKVSAVAGHYLHVNHFSQRNVISEDGSIVEIDQLTTNAEYFEAYAQASQLHIEWLESPENGAASVLFTDKAEVAVNGNAVSFTDLDAPVQEVVVTAEITPEFAPLQEPSQRESADLGENSEEAADIPNRSVSVGDPLEQIMSLTGLLTVKEQIQAFTRMVHFNQLREKQGLKASQLTMHSMFLGNPGTGKTTVARLLGKALFESGAIQRDIFIEVGRQDLVGEHLGASALKTQKVLESARGGVLFIDEAYSLYQQGNNSFGQEAVDTLLTFMENHRDDIVIIFAGYTSQMQDFLRMNPGMISRVPNQFDFEDFSRDEIADIGYQGLLEADYTVNESLYREVIANEYGKSTDKSNGRWVRNFNDELVKQMAQRVFSGTNSATEDLARITDDDVYNVAGGDSTQKEEQIQLLLAQLDELTGLTAVKDWVRKLVNRVKVDQQRLRLDGSTSRPNYHMVFSGNPGTGKTTVAKIIAQLFYNLGILEKTTVKEVDRSTLVGSWIGHTEEKTKKALDDSMGGVLFVDEAYQLHLENSANDFGKQAIETFVTRLENDRDKFVAIFAGYTADMERFLSSNPGLRSRIPLTIEFPDYSPEEVARITVNNLEKNWNFDEAVVIDTAVKIYSALEGHDKANARWARTFAELIEAEHIEYVAANNIAGAAMKQISSQVIESLLVR